ncbi:MAG: hypothetical protein JSS34_04505 [Proteobacteria bacterium]|nr:hypothetical protein [Pseudomonadota bacterium]
MAQIYMGHQFEENLNFFASAGILHVDSYITSPFHEVSSASGYKRIYWNAGGIYIFPVIEESVQPAFRLSTSRLESITNSYIWDNTYNNKVKCHQQTVDPAFRLSFLSFENVIPYVEYGPHWIADTSRSLNKTPRKRWGQTFTDGATITPIDQCHIGIFYSRSNLRIQSDDGFYAPGSQDYYSIKISRSF